MGITNFELLVICGGTGLLLNVLMWILVPKDDGVVDYGSSSFRST
jgi:hypothetical protein